jgi:hypothetical protein
MFSKSLGKHFKGFDSRFTKLHTKRDADILILPSNGEKTIQEVEKAVKTMCVHSMVSHGRPDAIGLWKCDLGLPSHFISPRQLYQ